MHLECSRDRELLKSKERRKGGKHGTDACENLGKGCKIQLFLLRCMHGCKSSDNRFTALVKERNDNILPFLIALDLIQSAYLWVRRRYIKGDTGENLRWSFCESVEEKSEKS